MVLLCITILLFIGYSILINYYWLSWRSIPEFFPKKGTVAAKISVIIPARNEEKNIGALLQGLEQQTLSRDLFEVIVIDDDSTDKTSKMAREFAGTILVELKDRSLNSYKKKAIEHGISKASGKLIVTTDADCIPPPQWLETLLLFHQENNSAFIAGPVAFLNNSSFLETFQALDFLVLQGITAASVYRSLHSMCNGANLAYEKEAFFAVNGFSNIDRIASGDDMLLMHKIRKEFPGQVHYLKSKQAIVSTQPMKNWKEFFNQRIRWASKARFYDDVGIFWALLLVYLFSLSQLVILIAGFWNLKFVIWFLLIWVAKTIVEFPFVSSVAKFFGKQSLLKYFFLFQPVHMVYTVIAGFFGQFGSYEWKGRRVK